jgi:hypothetical protein
VIGFDGVACVRSTIRRHRGGPIATAFAACSSFESQSTDNGSDAGLDNVAPDASVEETGSDGAVDAAVGTDAPADAPTVCDSRGLFDPPILLAGVNTTFGDYSSQLTPDELTVYFSSKRSPANGDELYVATRATRGAAFDAPVRMTALSTPSTDNYPAPSSDGLELFFARVVTSQYDVYVSRRATVDAGFDTATAVAAVNTAVNDAEPYVAQNGDLYFDSSRRTLTGVDIFRLARLSDGGFGTLEAVEEVDTAADDTSPVLTSDMLTLYLFSTRVDSGGTASGQIWVAHRLSAAAKFDPPTRVVELSTAAGGDYATWISPDNCRLYLTSLRSGVPQIYVATRRP